MKKLKGAFAASLFAAALATAALFVCTLRIGDFTGSETDLAAGLGTVIAVLVTAIPAIAGLPVALSLAVIAVCLFACKKQRGSAVAALVFLSVFLPAFVFAVAVDCSVFASRSALLIYILTVCAVFYLAAFALSIAYTAALSKAAKAEKAENAERGEK